MLILLRKMFVTLLIWSASYFNRGWFFFVFTLLHWRLSCLRICTPVMSPFSCHDPAFVGVNWWRLFLSHLLSSNLTIFYYVNISPFFIPSIYQLLSISLLGAWGLGWDETLPSQWEGRRPVLTRFSWAVCLLQEISLVLYDGWVCSFYGGLSCSFLYALKSLGR